MNCAGKGVCAFYDRDLEYAGICLASVRFSTYDGVLSDKASRNLFVKGDSLAVWLPSWLCSRGTN